MIKNIIFDFDGVIENTYDFCYKIEKERDSSLTHKKFKLFYCGNYWDCVDKKLITKKNIEIYENKYSNEIQKRDIKIEIKKFLEKLSKKYNLFIVSSCSEKNIKLYLKKNKIDLLFKEVLGRETHYSKIKKFEMIFKRYETCAKKSIFITDTLGDIIEANHVKMKTFAVTWGYHNIELLKQGNPEKIINEPSEIFVMLENISY